MSLRKIPPLRMMNPNTSLYRDWHDYERPGVYLITLERSETVLPFAEIKSTLKDDYPEVFLTRTGECLSETVRIIRDCLKDVVIESYAILPDYIHLLLRIRGREVLDISVVVYWFKAEANRRFIGYDADWEAPDSESWVCNLFTDGFEHRVARRHEDLNMFRRFIRTAYARYLDLAEYRFNFHSRFLIQKAVDGLYEGYGNKSLLEDPQIVAVRVSSRFSDDEMKRRLVDWTRTVDNGGVLVSPFVSSAEREIMVRSIEKGGRLIRLLPNGFGDVYYPSPELYRAVGRGRVLLLAPTTVNPSINRPDRRLCEAMNATAELIACGKFLP